MYLFNQRRLLPRTHTLKRSQPSKHLESNYDTDNNTSSSTDSDGWDDVWEGRPDKLPTDRIVREKGVDFSWVAAGRGQRIKMGVRLKMRGGDLAEIAIAQLPCML
ncbi:hypothetical protein GB937_008170 [Aspergillus fischeri]|nr:hypothetical protein GB937_008170 [Aspergillus fischeri]